MTQGRLSADIECDPASKTNHRNTRKASAGPVYSYEKRPRRKTKVDRYEPYKEPSASEQGSSRPKHSQKRTIVMKRNNSRVAEKFHAKNVMAGRLTLISNEKLGIFKKGKTSSPISCVKVSYPNFSELQFLAKDPQAATPKEEGNASLNVVKRTRLPSSEGSTTLIEEELFQALADCRQLTIPYEEFVPRFPNRRPVSLDNLKGLCKETDMMWLERKENHAIGTDSSTSCHTRTGDACLSIFGHNNATSDLGQGEEMFDMVLESVQSVDEDLALEVLAELVDAETLDSHIYELQPAEGRAGCAYDIEAMAPTFSYDVPRMLEHDYGTSTVMGHAGEITIIPSATHRHYDGTILPEEYNSQYYRDMEKKPTSINSGVGILSALDDRQSPQKPTPNQSAAHMPIQVVVQPTNTTSQRPFWRCNRLY